MPTVTRTSGLTLVGYFPKNTSVPAAWSASEQVKEICSVSHCVNSPPPDWIDRWLHNEWGFFNSQQDATSVVPSGCEGFSVFAYRLLPVRFVHGRAERLAIGDLTVEPMQAAFVSLGFDVVNKVWSVFFECSPLSCNYMAGEVPVNDFCLVADLEQAILLAERFSREEPEPGPYYVLEVLREAASA